MPNFKTGLSTPTIADSHAPTLDSIHQDKLEAFDALEEEAIPAMEARLHDLIGRQKDMSVSLDERLVARDRARSLRRRLHESKRSRKDYYLDNAKHIFSYFENKQLTSKGLNHTKVLTDFFARKPVKVSTKPHVDTASQAYIANIDRSKLDMAKYTTDVAYCPGCGKGEMIPIEHEGIRVCSSCGRSERFLVEHEKPSYKEPPQEVCFYAYKRINHFREILAQFQAKETTQIPPAVLSGIKAQIKKERISLSQLTNRRTKDILKKLGYNKYYEHIPFIKDKLGIRPPVMSPELEDTLCNLFLEIQAPYAKFCPDDRVNFLNYYYTVYKLCELLDEQSFLPYFPMLKDRDKRIEQDEIWRKICKELGWEFIPTV